MDFKDEVDVYVKRDAFCGNEVVFIKDYANGFVNDDILIGEVLVADCLCVKDEDDDEDANVVVLYVFRKDIHKRLLIVNLICCGLVLY